MAHIETIYEVLCVELKCKLHTNQLETYFHPLIII